LNDEQILLRTNMCKKLNIFIYFALKAAD
jgi:hypothetical protein